MSQSLDVPISRSSDKPQSAARAPSQSRDEYGLHSTIVSALRRQRHFDELIAPRRCRVDFSRYRRFVATHHGPDIGAEHNQSEFPAGQILLIPDVLIGRNHHVEPRFFRCFEKLAVFKLWRPGHPREGVHLMMG